MGGFRLRRVRSTPGRSPSVPVTMRFSVYAAPDNHTGRPRDAPRRRTVRLTESRLQAMIKRPFEHHAGPISAKCCLKNTPNSSPIKRWHIRPLLFAMTMQDAISAVRQIYIGHNTSFLSWVYGLCSAAILYCLRNLFAYWNLLLACCFLYAHLWCILIARNTRGVPHLKSRFYRRGNCAPCLTQNIAKDTPFAPERWPSG
jgi:hypothetical protein